MEASKLAMSSVLLLNPGSTAVLPGILSIVATSPVMFALQYPMCYLCSEDHFRDSKMLPCSGAAYCLQDGTKGFMDCWLQSSFYLEQVTFFCYPLWNTSGWSSLLYIVIEISVWELTNKMGGVLYKQNIHMLMGINPSDHFPVWRDLDTALYVISPHLCIQAAFPFFAEHSEGSNYNASCIHVKHCTNTKIIKKFIQLCIY